MYAKITDGKITEGPCQLPQCTATISGFNLLGDADLKKHGWLPVIDLDAECDSASQKITGYSTKIETDRVVRTPIVESLSINELVASKKAELKRDAELAADAEFEKQAIAEIGG